jgi:enoyl-CoA hydratase/carnithine racemase
MEMMDLYCRILTLSVPTMAVITGHCIAGGFFLAQCHDHLVMTSNPKFKTQLNESVAGIGMFSVYMILLKEILDTRTARTLILGGVVRSKQALELDLIQGLYNDNDELKS